MLDDILEILKDYPELAIKVREKIMSEFNKVDLTKVANNIINDICEWKGIKKKYFLKTRKLENYYYRISIILFLRRYGLSLKKIAKIVCKDHTTIMNSIAVAYNLIYTCNREFMGINRYVEDKFERALL